MWHACLLPVRRSCRTRCHGATHGVTPHPQSAIHPSSAPTKRHICAVLLVRASRSNRPLPSYPLTHPPHLMETGPQPPRRRALAAPHSAAGLRCHACAVRLLRARGELSRKPVLHSFFPELENPSLFPQRRGVHSREIPTAVLRQLGLVEFELLRLQRLLEQRPRLLQLAHVLQQLAQAMG